ncbi:choline dehydrogenase-like flavoprotein [Cereibacter changlensis]|uniref:Choline dehydrogenase-like flavoprotein n=2 Tax=Cereibacter changlensis TaxID=402884 RepID=A0A2W7SW81_9RHOB|nr:GMC oxidoreductase [Cereibacter changlensis]PZX55052.1 choline dehydrogenase-like flavoprotein [Cereibacter changlensis]
MTRSFDQSAFDVAIVGSGPAGLAVASRLIGHGLSIALIEAGNERHDPQDERQSFAAENAVSVLHPAAHLYRRRMLGGASTSWGGRCIPFDRVDFSRGAGGMGWPFPLEEVERHVPEALDFLDAGRPEHDETAFAEPLRWNSAACPDLDLDTIERFSLPTDLWRKLRGELRDRPDLQLIPDHLVLSVELAPDGGSAVALRVLDRQRQSERRLVARQIVLACGGIETTRLLLASRSVAERGIGNHSDHLGRHYMTHVMGDIGELVLAPGAEQAKLDYRRTHDGVYGRSLIRIAEARRLRDDLPNAVWRPTVPPVWDPAHGSAILSAVHLAKELLPKEYSWRLVARDGSAGAFGWTLPMRHAANILHHPVDLARFLPQIVGKRFLAARKLPSVFLLNPGRRYRMEINAEQMPDPESRIALAETRDRYGMPLIRLDWRMDEATVEGVRRNLAVLAESFRLSGVGHFDYDPDLVADSLASQSGHHMGTTRMARLPEEGVVDPEGAVFGVANLHVVGASVFPTSGAVNPTLLATCLAFRLAGGLLRQLRPGVQRVATAARPEPPRHPLAEQAARLAFPPAKPLV